MRTSKSIAVLGFFIAKSGCSPPPQHSYLDRRMGDPVTQLCYPNYDEYIISGSAPSLIDSPYPCEVQAAMESICSPNGTTTLDFLAEQECLCDGAFFDVSRGCNNCFFVNGEGEYTPSDAAQYFSALSVAECNALPTQPFQSMSASFSPSFSSSASYPDSSAWPTNDHHPTHMAVSDYWTATGSVTIGAITGSATARATTNIRWSIIGDTTLVTATGPSTSSSASSTIIISLSNTSGSRKVAAIDVMGACAELLTVLITFVVLL
jgi:hypothetical protein